MIIRALDTLVFENNGASETSARMEASTSRAAARLVRLLEVPDSELLADNDPFLAPWRDVARRFNATATPAQRHRWIDGHRSMLTAVTWERVYVVSNEIPTLNEYASIRMHTIGVGPVRAAIEFTRCIDVPDEEMYSPVVQAINEAWGLLAGWDNDLFSYSRHRMLNGGREPVLNLVGLLILTHGYSLQDAFLHAVELRNRVMRLIVRLRAQIMPLASPDLRAYLTGVVCAIRGSLDWYNQRQVEGSSSVDGLDSAPDLELTVQLTDISAPDADKPIDMPAIAWWWDLLEG
ncbi:terpene synthase family protein [Kribbella sp. NPDC051587]|uniref:terpene synthase family protein n=1 Tax=Kribbella sp. NPDC051587 TaxID=3364119 RepID=UPI003795E55C